MAVVHDCALSKMSLPELRQDFIPFGPLAVSKRIVLRFAFLARDPLKRPWAPPHHGVYQTWLAALSSLLKLNPKSIPRKNTHRTGALQLELLAARSSSQSRPADGCHLLPAFVGGLFRLQQFKETRLKSNPNLRSPLCGIPSRSHPNESVTAQNNR